MAEPIHIRLSTAQIYRRLTICACAPNVMPCLTHDQRGDVEYGSVDSILLSDEQSFRRGGVLEKIGKPVTAVDCGLVQIVSISAARRLVHSLAGGGRSATSEQGDEDEEERQSGGGVEVVVGADHTRSANSAAVRSSVVSHQSSTSPRLFARLALTGRGGAGRGGDDTTPGSLNRWITPQRDFDRRMYWAKVLACDVHQRLFLVPHQQEVLLKRLEASSSSVVWTAFSATLQGQVPIPAAVTHQGHGTQKFEAVDHALCLIKQRQYHTVVCPSPYA
ncbi:uncharacterized protein MYCFIDRAFT_170781 [Pseudocercospora fijiensis CIRAD86]|uniref:Uncharacterized protein n=1 Tax=Pseudocercospora fijiensis (strain CIRAD86) TaxID=383855 RepID=N1QCS5_PSEFD|nr:uncharacterized protein MYCFIDRAFT_170781 [Pseudocercospora fijiensis CIRAD86]EME89308.1 hypothetical protein MYCFIDRAFT_170781 [Pseudocercospora fijiensis CIRAD86]